MTTHSPYRISFVCTGNICRSPMGAVILRRLLEDEGLQGQVEVDSAGTGDWHVGNEADERTLRALTQHGYDGATHRAQQLDQAWVADHDLVLAADRSHLEQLRDSAPDLAERVRLLREFDPEAVAAGQLEVDDPYFGDAAGFDRCLAEVERACRGLVEHVRERFAAG
ncbi:low molecular weight protein-tyrosine-phosphatase [Segeticoccus rhizosphaerae]|jgi:protein-tyrosine phosphatase|uniref:low molecular weight protein-tyrosine-phosphatase n=1 Tax=Segeticoccus rhizosphaerae TaxID=1104777 RepID=UPI0010BF7128|nr:MULTISPECIES: low molecular weight protein-tyrosine-phosphatase [Intrasporangiaceae]